MRWLLKTEPSTYSFDDLVKERTATWDGITNAAALKHLREVKVGDDLLIYHTGDEKAVVGTAKVSKAAYADPKQDDPKLVVIGVKAGKRLGQPVTISQIKAYKRFAGWDLIRMSRLSVVPTSDAQWNVVMALAGEE
jgi:predicted RNA-binding protein with PUA-like domain